MNELIELSNYLIFNYWWIIFPSALVWGCLATYIQYRLENPKKEFHEKIIDNER